jgi:hypothetical protein
MFDQFLGTWRGTNRLYFEGANGPELVSPTSLTATLTLGKFLELRFDWAYEGKPKEGLILFSPDGTSAAYADTFHSGNAVMSFKGEPLNVVGSYSVPGHEPWGWRVQLAEEAGVLKLTMYNIEPNGTEHLAVLADYRK